MARGSQQEDLKFTSQEIGSNDISHPRPSSAETEAADQSVPYLHLHGPVPGGFIRRHSHLWQAAYGSLIGSRPPSAVSTSNQELSQPHVTHSGFTSASTFGAGHELSLPSLSIPGQQEPVDAHVRGSRSGRQGYSDPWPQLWGSAEALSPCTIQVSRMLQSLDVDNDHEKCGGDGEGSLVATSFRGESLQSQDSCVIHPEQIISSPHTQQANILSQQAATSVITRRQQSPSLYGGLDGRRMLPSGLSHAEETLDLRQGCSNSMNEYEAQSAVNYAALCAEYGREGAHCILSRHSQDQMHSHRSSYFNDTSSDFRKAHQRPPCQYSPLRQSGDPYPDRPLHSSPPAESEPLNVLTYEEQQGHYRFRHEQRRRPMHHGPPHEGRGREREYARRRDGGDRSGRSGRGPAFHRMERSPTEDINQTYHRRSSIEEDQQPGRDLGLDSTKMKRMSVLQASRPSNRWDRTQQRHRYTQSWDDQMPTVPVPQSHGILLKNRSCSTDSEAASSFVQNRPSIHDYSQSVRIGQESPAPAAFSALQPSSWDRGISPAAKIHYHDRQELDDSILHKLGGPGPYRENCMQPFPAYSKVEAPAAKRAELSESPTTRMQLKDFYRQLRSRERVSSEAAKEYAVACLDLLPKQLHWRVYLEIADLARRENHIAEARQYHREACSLQPYASQAWLEFSKLEEECGNADAAGRLLHRGLRYCEFSEGLLIRAIRHEERRNNIEGARQLLGRVKHAGVERTWRVVLEGALLEARAGNIALARRIFQFLASIVPWYGPIYNEAFRLEEKAENHATALRIVECGLSELPQYGPLWFGAFRLCERIDMQAGEAALTLGRPPNLNYTRDAIHRALQSSSLSKELRWKVHLEAAQIEGRAACSAAAIRVSKFQPAPSVFSAVVAKTRDELMSGCRRSYVEAVLSAQPNLRWKVWIAGARSELFCAGKYDVSRHLLNRALAEVPEKSKAHVFLECARLEEYVGATERARRILMRSRLEAKADWKIFLESVLLDMRAGNWQEAMEEAEAALKIHMGTGRLWAVLVQLHHIHGDCKQHAVLKQAVREVPKSGEVWCEGARIHLSPTSRCFDLVLAERYLDFAIQFTPQYGDSFLELMRLTMLRGIGVPHAIAHMADLTDLKATAVTPSIDEFLAISTEDVERRCSDADPNYGMLWLHFHAKPSDTPSLILRQAKYLLAQDLCSFYPLYLAALHRRFKVESKLRETIGRQDTILMPSSAEHCLSYHDPERLSPLDNPHQMSVTVLSNTSNHLKPAACTSIDLLQQSPRRASNFPPSSPMAAAGAALAAAASSHRGATSSARLQQRADSMKARNYEQMLLHTLQAEEPVEVDISLGVQQGDFVTGLVGLNRMTSRVADLPDEDRRKILFGSDQVLP